MKKLVTLALLAATGSFAFDQYLPVAKGKLETDVMFGYTSVTGGYDADGEKNDVPSGYSPASMAPALQLKYGIIDGLDVSLALNYTMVNEDLSYTGEAVSGLGAPELAVKYVVADLGVGGFLNLTMPFGSEDIVGEEPGMGIMGGVIYGKTFGQVVVNALAGYEFNTENGAKMKQDNLSIYAQGQYNVTPMVGPYLGVDFNKSFDMKYDGEAIDETAGQLLTLKPGAKIVINEQMAAELTVPVTVLGKNNTASWGIAAGFYYTLGL